MTRGTLSGRIALVTGASGRIGREIALSLAARGIGIIAHYNHSRKEIESLCGAIESRGTAAWPLQADFSRKGSAESLVERAVRLSGRFDILVNSASLYSESTARTCPEDVFFREMRVNAWAPLALVRAFSRTCRKGSVVNLLDSRIAGGDPRHAAYIVSKRALEELTRMMAREFAPGVSVNAVAPGLVRAPGAGSRRAARKLPLKRAAAYADVAEAVVYLLKSSSITGQTIWVDGGRNLRETR